LRFSFVNGYVGNDITSGVGREKREEGIWRGGSQRVEKRHDDQEGSARADFDFSREKDQPYNFGRQAGTKGESKKAQIVWHSR